MADLSLEDLANIEITSVSRRQQPLSHAAASVYVIAADAIRRSGAASLAQALLLAPNLQVARTDAGQYAISARGFNNAIGNKLLVLIDGRTVYTSFFSGVFWDQQDVLLEDVERIEVVSGPGATLWGANAVNGVINVITRAAEAAARQMVAVQAGAQEQMVGAHASTTLGAGGALRAYAKRIWVQNSRAATGAPVGDGMSREQAGWRADWRGTQDSLTIQADAYIGRYDQRPGVAAALPAVEFSGSNLLARWTRVLPQGGELRVQAYTDHMQRDDPLLYRPTVDTEDIEVQHSMAWQSHSVVLGADWRRARDDLQPGVYFGFQPARRTQNWYSLFAQDDWQFAPAWSVTAGIKVEHNDFTGAETLPTLRLSWEAKRNHLLWAGLSRAVRAPARLDRDIRLPPKPPYIIAGGDDFQSEVARVAEFGYRGQLSEQLNLSLTAFVHQWQRLRSGQPPPNAQVQNMIAGHTSGLEAWATWQVLTSVRLSAGLATLREALQVESGSTDPVGPSALGNDPRAQWSLRAAWTGAAHEMDLMLRHVGTLPDPRVPAYTALDLRWAWQVKPALQLELLGHNVADAAHPEFGGGGRAEIGRSWQLRLQWTP